MVIKVFAFCIVVFPQKRLKQVVTVRINKKMLAIRIMNLCLNYLITLKLLKGQNSNMTDLTVINNA